MWKRLYTQEYNQSYIMYIIMKMLLMHILFIIYGHSLILGIFGVLAFMTSDKVSVIA